MSQDDWLPEAEREWFAEQKRFLDGFVRFVSKWPNFRKQAACALLGSAIGVADMMGVDVEEELRAIRSLRKKPNPIAPGPRSAS